MFDRKRYLADLEDLTNSRSMDRYDPPATPAVSAQRPSDPESLLTTVEAAAWLGCGASTLHKRRIYGDSPTYLRIGPKTIRYRLGDLMDWAKARSARNTSEYLIN